MARNVPICSTAMAQGTSTPTRAASTIRMLTTNWGADLTPPPAGAGAGGEVGAAAASQPVVETPVLQLAGETELQGSAGVETSTVDVLAAATPAKVSRQAFREQFGQARRDRAARRLRNLYRRLHRQSDDDGDALSILSLPSIQGPLGA